MERGGARSVRQVWILCTIITYLLKYVCTFRCRDRLQLIPIPSHIIVPEQRRRRGWRRGRGKKKRKEERKKEMNDFIRIKSLHPQQTHTSSSNKSVYLNINFSNINYFNMN